MVASLGTVIALGISICLHLRAEMMCWPLQVVNEHRGSNYPIMNMQERVLSESRFKLVRSCVNGVGRRVSHPG